MSTFDKNYYNKQLRTKAYRNAKKSKEIAEKLLSSGEIKNECMECGYEGQLYAFSLNGEFQGLYCMECLCEINIRLFRV